MLHKKFLYLVAAIVAFSMLASACTSETAEVDPAGASNEPKVLRGASVARTTANPQMYTNSKVMNFYGTMVATLSTVDGSEKITFVPHHASELPSSEDGIVWTVKFRDDLKWANDGSKIDANTYYYTLQQLLNPKLANKNAEYLFDPCVVLNAKAYYAGECDWEDVGIKLIDDLTLEITLEYITTPLDFWTVIGAWIWPVHPEMYESLMNADGTSTTYGTSLETTPSCGAWILTEWIIDGHETLATNPDDPLVKMGYYSLDGYNERAVSQNATRGEMFFAGELDSYSLTGPEYNVYKNDPRAHAMLSANVWGYFMNGKSKNTILQDQDFRQALYYAAPRVAVAEEVYVLYLAAPHIISTGIMVGDPLGEPEYFRDTEPAKKNMEIFHDDDELALELFNKAWEKNGSVKVTIEITYFDGQEDMKRTAEVMQEKCENLFGSDRIEFVLRPVVPANAYDNYRVADYDIGIGVRLANIFNPWSSMSVWTQNYTGKYITGFESDEFDDLYFQCMYGDYVNDPEKRIEALARMEYLLLEYGAFIPLMQNNNTVMYNERLELVTEKYLPFVAYAAMQCDITPY